MLAQVAQRGSRCSIPGNIPGQVGRGSEQPGLIEDVPAHCGGVGLDGLWGAPPMHSKNSWVVKKRQKHKSKGGGNSLHTE